MEEEAPDLYADGLTLTTGNYGVTLVLYRSDPPNVTQDKPGRIVGRIRMSADLAGALGELIRNVIVPVETGTGSRSNGGKARRQSASK